MTSLKGLNLKAFSSRPKLPAPRIVPNGTAEFEKIVANETRLTDAEIAITDAIIDSSPRGEAKTKPVLPGLPGAPDEQNIDSESEKLARLVADDFPFDDSQLAAVTGMVQQQYACMIGAAGTGKTTLEKKLVDLLQDGLDEIDVSQYWKRGTTNEHDDYETPRKPIPSILMCSFTGRSTQMTKKNFPTSWHPNIMTIHRALGFYPEFYPDVDEETGELVNKRRFVPAYTADNLMPWDIILIDEAGMLGLDLWHQLWAATKPGCRIYMIGDINQLPPTHGKSILGFALSKWPTWELTHVHRQQGANNSIVDNAHRVLKGLRPISDSPKPLSLKPDSSASGKEKMRPMLDALSFMTQNSDWRFVTIEVEDEHKVAAIRIRQMLKLLHGKIYEPNRDVVITPINGFEQTAPGYSLGQSPMNQELVTLLNQDSPRYIIDAGREKQNFAVGDKVMATVNDYEAGITNGMTGIIKSIEENGAYIWDTRRFGLISDVNDYFAGLVDEEDDDVDFSLDEMVSDSQAGMDELRKKEKGAKGPASHVVTVIFGEGDASFEVAFSTQSQVASLMLAYVATCHKMQGGECPLVFVICHAQNKRPLNREWLYTAITRGSHRVVLLYTRQGVGFAIGKQSIKGSTLKAKIASFAKLTEDGLVGPALRVKLPAPRSLVETVNLPTLSTEEKGIVEYEEEPNQPAPEIEATANDSQEEASPSPREKVVFRDRVIIVEKAAESSRTVDGGELRAQKPDEASRTQPSPRRPELNFVRKAGPVASLFAQGKKQSQSATAPALPKPQAKLVSQYGAAITAVELAKAQVIGQRLLSYSPAKPAAPKNRLGALLAKQAIRGSK
jgi:hypothetical protein